MTESDRIVLEQIVARLYELSREHARMRREIDTEISKLSEHKRSITNSILVLNNTHTVLRSLSDESERLHDAVMRALGISERRNTDHLDTDPGTPSAIAAANARKETNG